MSFNPSIIISRVLKASSRRQRRAALIAAVCCACLLAASIVLVIVMRTDMLQPTPTNEAQMLYTLAREAEKAAAAAAKQRGTDPDTDPDLVAARIELARAQLALGQLSQAASLSARLLSANPDNVAVVRLRANVLEQQGKMSAALEKYQRVLELVGGGGNGGGNGDSDVLRDTWRGIGACLLALGDKTAALDALERAASVTPQTPSLYIEAADIAYSLGLWQRAAENYYRARLFDVDVNALSEKLRELELKHPSEVKAARAAVEASFGAGTRGTE